MNMHQKSVADLRSELELIDRTIVALENLGRLRSELITPSRPASSRRAPGGSIGPTRPRKPLQTQ